MRKECAGDPGFPFTPIVIVTAMAESRDVVAGFEAGGDDYLTKPVDQHALAQWNATPAGHILISQRVHAAAADLVDAESVGELTLDGFQRPMPAYSVRAMKG